MLGCSRNFSKTMAPEKEEYKEEWECLEVWKCDNNEPEEPVLIWSKEGKESGLLGSSNNKSLAECEKETSHHSVYTKPRSVSMKDYDEWLLNEIQKPVSAPFWVKAMRALKSIYDSGGS